ncbi:MAG: DNA repair protein RecO [Deltaproteobacteria bacterium]|nr:DNA repair protein RecO [Deltaproteobacteria bacterium]
MSNATAAVLLRRRALREADCLCTYFTATMGKLTGVAPHGRRSYRRFGGALEPGTIGRIRYAAAEGADLVRLEDASVEWSPQLRPFSLTAFAAMGVLLDIVDATTAPQHADADKYAAVAAALPRLGTQPRATLLQWSRHWLALLGLAPDVERCGRCGLPVAPDVVRWFSPAEGGAICPRCRQRDDPDIAFAPPDRAAWDRLAEDPAPAMQSLPVRRALWACLQHAASRRLVAEPYWTMIWEGSDL